MTLTVTLAVVDREAESVTVTSYVVLPSAGMSDTVEFGPPNEEPFFFQLNVYGDVPPLGFAVNVTPVPKGMLPPGAPLIETAREGMTVTVIPAFVVRETESVTV